MTNYNELRVSGGTGSRLPSFIINQKKPIHMKLLTIEAILLVIAIVMKSFMVPFAWIPLSLACVAFVLILSILWNVPVLGLLGAKIEMGKKLFFVYLPSCRPIDSVVLSVTFPDKVMRVLHYRYIRAGYYKIWVKAYPAQSFLIKNP